MLDARMHEFQQMRCNTLNSVVSEERRRYSSVLLGLVRVARAQAAHCSQVGPGHCQAIARPLPGYVCGELMCLAV